jgi:hypothetical protein
MSFSSLLSENRTRAEYLAILSPRRRILGSDFTVDGTYSIGLTTYYRLKVSFTWGPVSAVSIINDDYELPHAYSFERTSVAALVQDDEFYYDYVNQVLYISVITTTNLVVYPEYDLYLGTKPAYWYKNPLSATTQDVYYDGIIQNAPSFKVTTEDVLFGYTPVESSVLSLINEDQVLNRHLYDSSFNKCRLRVYQYMDKLKLANLELVFDAVCGNVTIRPSRVDITVYNGSDRFSQTLLAKYGPPYAYLAGISGLWTSIDPNFLNKACRTVYGQAENLVMACISVGTTDGTDSKTERAWYVHNGGDNSHDLSLAVTSTGSNTTTLTHLTSVTGLFVGDRVWCDRASGTDGYVLIDAIDTVAKTITHSTTPLASALSSTSDRVKRSFMKRLFILQGGVEYEAYYGRDWVPSYVLFEVGGPAIPEFPQIIHFKDALESNLSLPSAISTEDTVYGTVYGQYAGNTSPLVDTIRSLLLQSGVTTSQIDSANFTSVSAQTTEAIGLSIPATWDDGLSDIGTVLNKALLTGLLKLSQSSDGLWQLAKLGPTSTAVDTVQTEDLEVNDYTYTLDYQDVISTVTVKYGQGQVNRTLLTVGQTFHQTTNSLALSSDVTAFHGVTKEQTFETLHADSTGANVFVMRLFYVLGDRKGTFEVTVPRRFIENEIEDSIDVSIERLPGTTFDAATAQTRSFKIQGFDKSKDVVSLTLGDQKGIEDHSSDWASPPIDVF